MKRTFQTILGSIMGVGFAGIFVFGQELIWLLMIVIPTIVLVVIISLGMGEQWFDRQRNIHRED